jgi:hypothetical protein
MGLEGSLELGETLAIGVQASQIWVIQRPQQDLGWRHRTLLTQQRIDNGIKSYQDIELGERDFGKVPGPVAGEVDAKMFLHDGDGFRRSRVSGFRDASTFGMHAWTEHGGGHTNRERAPTCIPNADKQ